MEHATRLRSFAKTLTYRISGSVITAAITLWATKQLDLALGVGLLDVTSKLVFYYLHERLWDHIMWGRVQSTPHFKQGQVESSSAHGVSDLSLEQIVKVRSCGPSTESVDRYSTKQASEQPE